MGLHFWIDHPGFPANPRFIPMRPFKLFLLVIGLSVPPTGCQLNDTTRKAEPKKTVPHVYPSMGNIERLDPALDALVPPGAVIEKLAEGFDWSEGPVWVKAGQYLLFSDVPQNIVYKWKEGLGTREYLFPSGYSRSTPRGGEPGSNGLLLDPSGRLVLCEHGDRRVARLEKNGVKTTLAEFYSQRRLNSPNDAVYASNGDLYFTDPPYGLEKQNQDPKKELMFNGVYRLPKSGRLQLVTSEMSYPNGIGLSIDEQTLYVANSDPERAIWMAFNLASDGTILNKRVFFDATALAKDRTKKGLPDGLKLDKQGNLYATGPGGVLIFTPEGKHLGTIVTGEATGNCAWGDNGSTLYINADMYLCRIKLSAVGQGF